MQINDDDDDDDDPRGNNDATAQLSAQLDYTEVPAQQCAARSAVCVACVLRVSPGQPHCSPITIHPQQVFTHVSLFGNRVTKKVTGGFS